MHTETHLISVFLILPLAFLQLLTYTGRSRTLNNLCNIGVIQYRQYTEKQIYSSLYCRPLWNWCAYYKFVPVKPNNSIVHFFNPPLYFMLCSSKHSKENRRVNNRKFRRYYSKNVINQFFKMIHRIFGINLCFPDETFSSFCFKVARVSSTLLWSAFVFFSIHCVTFIYGYVFFSIKRNEKEKTVKLDRDRKMGRNRAEHR